MAKRNPDLNDLDSQEKGKYAEKNFDRDIIIKGYQRISKECLKD